MFTIIIKIEAYNPRFVQRQKEIFRNGTLDEQVKECKHARERAKTSHNGGYSAFVLEKSTENHDGQRDQDRHHYRKTVNTT